MKLESKIAALVALFAIAAGGVFVAGCSKPADPTAATETRTLYTCGMHPQIIQDHPGNCPICGMKLTPIRKPDAQVAATNEQEIFLDPSTVQMMNIRTAAVANGPLRRTLRTVGAADFNETALADVTVKYRGWIEKLHADTTGAFVRAGEPLFEIYSPELYAAQAEFLAALETAPDGNRALADSARTKLKLFDLSDDQIAALEKSRAVEKTLTVTAPISGFVTGKNIIAGQMVEAGTQLYRLANLDTVWVFAQIYEQDLPFVQTGQAAAMTLSHLPGREFHGKVAYVYPTVDDKTRTARVRLEFPNSDGVLKPGMFAAVEIATEPVPSALLVPDSAVLRSGRGNTVFVALPGGKFEARAVTLGLPAQDGLIQILNGLNEGEQVVVSGQFMLDSESQLREAIGKMSKPQ